MMITRQHQGKQRGAVLIMTLSLLTLATLIAVAGMGGALIQERIAGSQRQIAQAFLAAEQGMMTALTTLTTDAAVSDWNDQDGILAALGGSGPHPVNGSGSAFWTADVHIIDPEDSDQPHVHQTHITVIGQIPYTGTQRILRLALARYPAGDPVPMGGYTCLGNGCGDPDPTAESTAAWHDYVHRLLSAESLFTWTSDALAEVASGDGIPCLRDRMTAEHPGLYQIEAGATVDVSSDVHGAGILILTAPDSGTGDSSISLFPGGGTFHFEGLVILVGGAEVNTGTANLHIEGAVIELPGDTPLAGSGLPADTVVNHHLPALERLTNVGLWDPQRMTITPTWKELMSLF
ncbi:PilX N-terminal [Ectothiorhodospira magna]|uniref:PilX N-terminal n=1 Tax=Ectothiorhodospira magna TaxID=867345 RepID=A0A1H9CI11_9GAMM|nr:pilus assembly PilX N-terminal domain-containing protein [Ectothiorhodospira magna]SEQ00836.1 PilX N-terminal [Ectothiorhodospira magna]